MAELGERIPTHPGMEASRIPIQTLDGPGAGKDSPGRLVYIDGLRGLAIAMVLLYHSWLFCGSPGRVWWNPLASGYLGVDLFLLLSGFCLYWPFVRQGSLRRQPSLRTFLGRRARRLLPPYYLALILFTLLALCVPSYPEGPHAGHGAIARTFVWHLLLLHNLRPGHITALAGPFWSLALEADLYIAMPILIVAAQRYGTGRAVALAATVSLIYLAGLDFYVGGALFWSAPPENNAYPVLANFVTGRWIEFGLGMWAADLIAHRRLDHSPLPLGLLAFAVLLAEARISNAADRFHALAILLTGLGFFCLILQGSREPGAHPIGMLSAALRARPLVRLGVVSYSVYLLHQPLLLMAVQASRPQIKLDGLLLAACLGLFLPIIIGLASLFHVACEKPFMNRPLP